MQRVFPHSDDYASNPSTMACPFHSMECLPEKIKFKIKQNNFER